MNISRDCYNFNLLKDGISYEIFVRNSSGNQFEKLLNSGLIWLNDENKIFLTPQGRVAQQLGLQKYFELENFEQKLLGRSKRKANLLTWLSMICCLGTSLLLFHISLLSTKYTGERSIEPSVPKHTEKIVSKQITTLFHYNYWSQNSNCSKACFVNNEIYT